MDEDPIYNLDRELNILRTLTERTPRGEGSLARGSTVENEGESRNDAVVGSSWVSDLSKDNRNRKGFTPPVRYSLSFSLSFGRLLSLAVTFWTPLARLTDRSPPPVKTSVWIGN
jgi:hypothetical protein